MRICFGSGNENTFAVYRNKHYGIIWLIAEGIRFSILDPKIGPVVVNLKREGRSGDCDVASKTFCDIEAGLFVTRGNYDLPFVSVLRREQANFRASAAAFANTTDLFVRRLAESENRFLKINCLILGGRGRAIR